MAALGLANMNFIPSDTTSGPAAELRVGQANNGVVIVGSQGTATSLDNTTFTSSSSSQVITVRAGQTPLSLTVAGSNIDANFVGLSPQDFTVEPLDALTSSGPALRLHIVPSAGVEGATTDITLPGYSTADLSDGRVSLNFESSSGLPALHLQTNG